MQTTYNSKPAIGVEGMIADSRIVRHIDSRIADGLIKAGRACFRSGHYLPGEDEGNPGTVVQLLSVVAAADVDAIVTTHATAATITTLDGTDLNGAVGAEEMDPPRAITLVLSSHADFNATNATVTGLDGDTGDVVTETVAIPDAGNTTVTTTTRFRAITEIVIPAQGGTGGSYTVGLAALAFTAADFEGVAVFDASVEPADDARAAEVEFGDGVAVPVLSIGPIYVKPEQAVKAGDDVYVRVAIGGAGARPTLGRFRKDSDSSTAVQLTNAKWGSKADADGLAILILR